MDIIELMRNPLTQEGRSGPFLRLVLAESARYGMPPQVIATLDDVAAMLGFYEPLPKSVASLVAGPLVTWRTHPDQPFTERVTDVEGLSYKQRCLIAFGGGQPGHMVGTAEIVCAMGNLHNDESVPEHYREIFDWAVVDVLHILTGDEKEEIIDVKKLRATTDDDVVRPGGRLNAIYQEMATNMRRTAIAAIKDMPDDPRRYLRPLALHFLRMRTRDLETIETEGLTELADRVRHTISSIKGMFPDLSIDERITAEREAGA